MMWWDQGYGNRIVGKIKGKKCGNRYLIGLSGSNVQVSRDFMFLIWAHVIVRLPYYPKILD